MRVMKLLIFFIYSLLILNQIIIRKSYSDINTNSIIHMFCIENFKSEMIKAKLQYEENLGKEVCNCYIRNISNNKSHERSISECKIESKKKFNL